MNQENLEPDENLKKKYANAYDKILKENLIETIKPFFKQLFQVDVENTEMEYILPALQKTLETEADFIAKIKHKNPADDFILHVEFQVKEHLTMQLRMNFYQAFIRTLHNIPIRQYVIYLGKGKSKMITFIKDEGLDFRYKLINFQEIDVNNFINSDVPEVIILGILADYKGQTPENIVDIILNKISKIDVTFDKKQKCVKQLEVLSNLRNLQKTIKQKINIMAFEYDIETDIRYLEGIEIGVGIGREEGVGIGTEKERERGILRMNDMKIKVSDIAHSYNITEQKVIEIIKRNTKK